MSDTITGLLQSWSNGQREAIDKLIPLVYRELREIARRRMSRESADHTLQPTELVHEVYSRLVRSEIPAKNRTHFYAICARLMRRILIDHSKSSLRQKRGAGAVMLTLNGFDVAGPDAPERILAIHEALEKLADFDQRKAQIVELVVFGGLAQETAAEALDISPATLRRDLKVAKAWLYHTIHDPGDGVIR
ncbi:MAG TPA: ECF-type sigma factor [Bryobacteraceae bacterium]|nr:ECF-type sigma factor [Bryobacteraceae bacterium]